MKPLRPTIAAGGANARGWIKPLPTQPLGPDPAYANLVRQQNATQAELYKPLGRMRERVAAREAEDSAAVDRILADFEGGDDE